MIVKYCIVSRDTDEVLRYFNLDTDDFGSVLDHINFVKTNVRSICSEFHLEIVDVEVYEKYDDIYSVDFTDYAEIICYDEV